MPKILRAKHLHLHANPENQHVFVLKWRDLESAVALESFEHFIDIFQASSKKYHPVKVSMNPTFDNALTFITDEKQREIVVKINAYFNGENPNDIVRH